MVSYPRRLPVLLPVAAFALKAGAPKLPIGDSVTANFVAPSLVDFLEESPAFAPAPSPSSACLVAHYSFGPHLIGFAPASELIVRGQMLAEGPEHYRPVVVLHHLLPVVHFQELAAPELQLAARREYPYLRSQGRRVPRGPAAVVALVVLAAAPWFDTSS